MNRTNTVVTGVWMKITNPTRIAQKRRRMGYTQANLAALVGVTQQYISAMERGTDTDCSEKIAQKLAKRLDLDLEDVFEERSIFSMPKQTTNNRGSRAAA